MIEKPLKVTITIKAESLIDLVNALTRIAEEASMLIVQSATVSTSLAIEAKDTDDLADALSDVARAVAASEGVEAKISAPATVWHGRRLDPTPMERMINLATGELR